MTESTTSAADAVIGGRLRAAREQAGISVEQLADVTRISRTYLHALEEGRFDRLPGSAYVSGFIRLYAAQVGLNPDSLVQEYQQLRQSAPMAGPTGTAKPRVAGFNPDGRRRWVVTGILLVLVLAAAYLMDSERPGKPPVAASVPPGPAPQQALSSAVPAPPPPPTAPAASPAPESEMPAVPAMAEPGQPGSGIFLRIKADRECWLNIDIDGEMGRQYTLSAGDIIEWKGERRFSLDIGNAGGIQAEFNGKPLGPLGKEGAPLHLELTAEGAQ